IHPPVLDGSALTLNQPEFLSKSRSGRHDDGTASAVLLNATRPGEASRLVVDAEPGVEVEEVDACGIDPELDPLSFDRLRARVQPCDERRGSDRRRLLQFLDGDTRMRHGT